MVNKNYQIILASQSPRRQELLKNLGINFVVRTKRGIQENFPAGLHKDEIAVYLADLKSDAFYPDLRENQLLITADTIVWHEQRVLNKPTDYNDARQMLSSLSGKTHEVITGICLRTKSKKRSFFSSTKVKFKQLKTSEIEFYIRHYKPFDKAGAYGIQEWIGMVAIESIEGSYFNVMGLPTALLYKELGKF